MAITIIGGGGSSSTSSLSNPKIQIKNFTSKNRTGIKITNLNPVEMTLNHSSGQFWEAPVENFHKGRLYYIEAVHYSGRKINYFWIYSDLDDYSYTYTTIAKAEVDDSSHSTSFELHVVLEHGEKKVVFTLENATKVNQLKCFDTHIQIDQLNCKESYVGSREKYIIHINKIGGIPKVGGQGLLINNCYLSRSGMFEIKDAYGGSGCLFECKYDDEDGLTRIQPQHFYVVELTEREKKEKLYFAFFTPKYEYFHKTTEAATMMGLTLRSNFYLMQYKPEIFYRSLVTEPGITNDMPGIVFHFPSIGKSTFESLGYLYEVPILIENS